MTRFAGTWTVGFLLVFTSPLAAQEASSEKNDNAQQTGERNSGVRTETIVTRETAMEREAPPPAPRYAGGLWERSTLTGDWGGVRDELADMGITLDVGLTQVLQGNAHGGASTKNAFRYSGSTDYTLTLDTGKMGLWPGGTLLLNAETKWADGIHDKVGALLPVNLDAFKPAHGEGCMMTLSEWIYFQALFEGKLVLVAGKLDGSRAFDRNLFANDERTQFMNLGFRNNPIIPAFLPYTNLGVGAIVNLTDWWTTTTAIADSEGRAKTTGFETAFHGSVNLTVIHEHSFHVKPFGLPGNQRIGMVYSSMDYPHHQPISPFRQSGPLLYNLMGPKLFGKVAKLLPYEHSSSNCGLYYNFDQYLYQEADDPTQGIGLFGRFGWARQDVNPIAHFYSLGVGGKGIIPERDQDTFGVGYYFSDLSNNLPYWMHSEQGIEAYYSFEIAPWLHISPDFQVIVNPGGSDEKDVALVYGARVQMDL